jgi:UDP-glucose 6-dehydrogenase
MSYKEDSYVLDESPSVYIARHLLEAGFVVRVWDPMMDSMLDNIPADVVVSEDLDMLLDNSRFLVLPRTLSAKDLNSILQWKATSTIFDPWGQIPENKGSTHQIIQIGRCAGKEDDN